MRLRRFPRRSTRTDRFTFDGSWNIFGSDLATSSTCCLPTTYDNHRPLSTPLWIMTSSYFFTYLPYSLYLCFYLILYISSLYLSLSITITLPMSLVHFPSLSSGFFFLFFVFLSLSISLSLFLFLFLLYFFPLYFNLILSLSLLSSQHLFFSIIVSYISASSLCIMKYIDKINIKVS